MEGLENRQAVGGKRLGEGKRIIRLQTSALLVRPARSDCCGFLHAF